MSRPFAPGAYEHTIDVRSFIQANYTPYEGGADFLCPPTARTRALMEEVNALLKAETEKGGVLDIDTERVSSLLTYPAGYIDKDKEIIVGLQTGAPLRRGVNPFGGIRMARQACEAYGYKLSDVVEQEFSYKTTHNDAVFHVYTDEMKAVRHAGLLTGLPDAYGRGRIIGDYRRVALYGVDRLIEEKRKDKRAYGERPMDEANIRTLEELYKQIDFLQKLKDMALLYGVDISAPAQNAKEAVQWTYFAYLAAIKEQNGAAESLGRVSTFFDIYIERDIADGVRHQAAHHPPAAHPRVQRAVRRRPDLDDGEHRRHGGGRPHAGHPYLFPLPAHPLQPRRRARTQPDRPLVGKIARTLQKFLCQSFHRHRLHPV